VPCGGAGPQPGRRGRARHRGARSPRSALHAIADSPDVFVPRGNRERTPDAAAQPKRRHRLETQSAISRADSRCASVGRRLHMVRERARVLQSARAGVGRGPGVRRRAVGPHRAPASVESSSHALAIAFHARERSAGGGRRYSASRIAAGAAPGSAPPPAAPRRSKAAAGAATLALGAEEDGAGLERQVVEYVAIVAGAAGIACTS